MTHPETARTTTRTTGTAPDVDALADEALGLALAASPIDATLLGIPGHDTALPDHTAAGEEGRRLAMQDLLERVDAAMGQVDDGQELVTLEVLREAVQGAQDQLAGRAAELTITDSFFAPASMLFFSLRLQLRFQAVDRRTVNTPSASFRQTMCTDIISANPILRTRLSLR